MNLMDKEIKKTIEIKEMIKNLNQEKNMKNLDKIDIKMIIKIRSQVKVIFFYLD